MKTDEQIQEDVMTELRWQPYLKASEIGVTVKNGVVTLTGTVDSYAKKLAAERVVKNIHGVRAVAENITVRLRPGKTKTDAEIAEAVLNSFKWHSDIQEENLKIKVENGFVTLEGRVQWGYEKEMIGDAVQNISGIAGVINNVAIIPEVAAKNVKTGIESALGRCARIPAEDIKVAADGSTVTLSGSVYSDLERKIAEQTAWNAPGVHAVVNKLEIRHQELVM